MDARTAELEQVRQDVDATLAEVRARTAELSQRRFEATAGHVLAVVDGQGRLVDLRIDDDAVGPRVAHPGLLGNEIVEAVTAARGAAADENARSLHTVLPGMFPAPAPERNAPAHDRDDWDLYEDEE